MRSNLVLKNVEMRKPEVRCGPPCSDGRCTTSCLIGNHGPRTGRPCWSRARGAWQVDRRPRKVQTVSGGYRPVRGPRLQGRGLHRQHRVREAPVGQAAREPRHGLRERRRPGAYAHGRRLFYHTWPKRGRPATTRSTSSCPTARRSVPSRSSRRITGHTPRWTHSAKSAPHASAGGTSSCTKDLDGDGARRLHPDLHVRVPVGRGMVTVDQIAAMMHVGRSTIYRCLNADSMKMD